VNRELLFENRDRVTRSKITIQVNKAMLLNALFADTLQTGAK